MKLIKTTLTAVLLTSMGSIAIAAEPSAQTILSCPSSQTTPNKHFHAKNNAPVSIQHLSLKSTSYSGSASANDVLIKCNYVLNGNLSYTMVSNQGYAFSKIKPYTGHWIQTKVGDKLQYQCNALPNSSCQLSVED